ncbi:MAG: thymidylate synthase [Chitinophagaceae bacterium]|nr:thymidylate synthase [Oligoflexus sp.]
MTHPEDQYLALLRKLLDEGDVRLDRTGVGTKAIFGEQMRFNLADGFPVFTTKRVYWKTAFKEILWMLSGSTSLKELLAQNVKIWSDWPLKKFREQTGTTISQEDFERQILEDENFNQKWGDLGPIYGKQWRRWKGADGREIDQVQQVIDLIKTNPSSRRILWEGWNVGELDQMALPPCHKQYQFFVNHKLGTLNGSCIQRSVDSYLGLTWNIANLALITHMLAEQTGYKPGEIVWFGMDTHLYLNHIEAAELQLSRTPRPLPRLIIKRKPASLFDYTIDDFDLEGYDPHPAIKADVAV